MISAFLWVTAGTVATVVCCSTALLYWSEVRRMLLVTAIVSWVFQMELKIESCQFLVQICSMNLCESPEKVKSWGSLRKISKQDELKSFFVSGLWRHFFAFYPFHVCQVAVFCCDCGGWLFKAVMQLWWTSGLKVTGAGAAEGFG